MGTRFLGQLLIKRARMQGFLVFDHAHRYDEARARLARWYRDGRLKYRDDVLEGIEAMPRAFLRLLHGRNFGKQLVKVSGAPD